MTFESELGQLVADLLELPDRQRGALVMRELNDLDYADIAAAFAISEAAAKQTVHEARSSLQDFAKGRDMSCDEVTRLISAEDRRFLRGRKVRAHLRHCEQCRDFKTAMATRRGDLAILAPPLSVPAAGALFHAVFGGAREGGGGGGLLGLAGGGAGQAATAATAVKGLAVAAATLTLAAGATTAEHVLRSDQVDRSADALPAERRPMPPPGLAPSSAPANDSSAAARAAQAAETDGRGAAQGGSDKDDGRDAAKAGDGTDGGPRDRARSQVGMRPGGVPDPAALMLNRPQPPYDRTTRPDRPAGPGTGTRPSEPSRPAPQRPSGDAGGTRSEPPAPAPSAPGPSRASPEPAPRSGELEWSRTESTR